MTRSTGGGRCEAPRCSGRLPATVRAGTRFCSPACRQRAYRAREREKELAYRQRFMSVCDRCGRFIRVLVRRRNGERRLVRGDIRYCSPHCRQLYHQQRRKTAPLRQQVAVPRGAARRRRDSGGF